MHVLRFATRDDGGLAMMRSVTVTFLEEKKVLAKVIPPAGAERDRERDSHTRDFHVCAIFTLTRSPAEFGFSWASKC